MCVSCTCVKVGHLSPPQHCDTSPAGAVDHVIGALTPWERHNQLRLTLSEHLLVAYMTRTLAVVYPLGGESQGLNTAILAPLACEAVGSGSTAVDDQSDGALEIEG